MFHRGIGGTRIFFKTFYILHIFLLIISLFYVHQLNYLSSPCTEHNTTKSNNNIDLNILSSTCPCLFIVAPLNII